MRDTDGQVHVAPSPKIVLIHCQAFYVVILLQRVEDSQGARPEKLAISQIQLLQNAIGVSKVQRLYILNALVP